MVVHGELNCPHAIEVARMRSWGIQFDGHTRTQGRFIYLFGVISNRFQGCARANLKRVCS